MVVVGARRSSPSSGGVQNGRRGRVLSWRPIGKPGILNGDAYLWVLLDGDETNPQVTKRIRPADLRAVVPVPGTAQVTPDLIEGGVGDTSGDTGGELLADSPQDPLTAEHEPPGGPSVQSVFERAGVCIGTVTGEGDLVFSPISYWSHVALADAVANCPLGLDKGPKGRAHKWLCMSACNHVCAVFDSVGVELGKAPIRGGRLARAPATTPAATPTAYVPGGGVRRGCQATLGGRHNSHSRGASRGCGLAQHRRPRNRGAYARGHGAGPHMRFNKIQKIKH